MAVFLLGATRFAKVPRCAFADMNSRLVKWIVVDPTRLGITPRTKVTISRPRRRVCDLLHSAPEGWRDFR